MSDECYQIVAFLVAPVLFILLIIFAADVRKIMRLQKMTEKLIEENIASLETNRRRYEANRRRYEELELMIKRGGGNER